MAGSRLTTSLGSTLIEPIFATCNLTRDQFFIAPGNHDIDKDAVDSNEALQSGLDQQLNSRDAINKFYDAHSKSPNSSFYFSRMAEFEAANKLFGQKWRVNSNPFYSSYHLPLGKEHIGILSLNSAWLSTGRPNDYDKSKLVIPERAITDGIADLSMCSFKVAILHHPFEYLRDASRSDCRALLIKNFDLICFGHVHDAFPHLIQSPLGQAVLN